MNSIKSRYRKYLVIVFSAPFLVLQPFLVYLFFVAYERAFDMRWVDYFMLILFFAFLIYFIRFAHLRLASIELINERLIISNFGVITKQITLNDISSMKESQLKTRMRLRDFDELKVYDSNGKLWFIISEHVYSNYDEIVKAIDHNIEY